MLVLDANILIRAALGARVLGLLRNYGGQVEFMTPDVAFDGCVLSESSFLKLLITFGTQSRGRGRAWGGVAGAAGRDRIHL